jgi:hypothetical protein
MVGIAFSTGHVRTGRTACHACTQPRQSTLEASQPEARHRGSLNTYSNMNATRWSRTESVLLVLEYPLARVRAASLASRYLAQTALCCLSQVQRATASVGMPASGDDSRGDAAEPRRRRHLDTVIGVPCLRPGHPQPYCERTVCTTEPSGLPTYCVGGRSTFAIQAFRARICAEETRIERTCFGCGLDFVVKLRFRAVGSGTMITSAETLSS